MFGRKGDNRFNIIHLEDELDFSLDIYYDDIWGCEEDLGIPYEGTTLWEAEEWGLCLPYEYNDNFEYQWLYGSEFGGEDYE